MKLQRGECWNKWRSNRGRTSIPRSCLQKHDFFQWRQTSKQAGVLLETKKIAVYFVCWSSSLCKLLIKLQWR